MIISLSKAIGIERRKVLFIFSRKAIYFVFHKFHICSYLYVAFHLKERIHIELSFDIYYSYLNLDLVI